MTITEEAQALAQELIESILTITKVDYSAHKDVIAHDIEEYVFSGNWDHTIEIEGMKDIRIIQEDEYEQSMDEDEQPENAFLTCGYYIDLW